MTIWADSIPVYSTETGRIKQTKNSPDTKAQKSDGFIRLRREVKGRGGGTVIVISGFSLAAPELRELAGILKKKCGCGGTIKDGTIEIQGDHRNTVSDELQSRGFKVKLAGG